jgi:Tfp pilus assembly protein PilP
MRAVKMCPWWGALAFGLVSPFALAQPPPPPASDTPRKEEKDTIKAILEQEMELPPGAYTYNAQGRRDPFVSLLKPVGPAGPGERHPGMEGFLIQEVALKGIVKSEGKYIAMLLGTDGKSYFCTVGQRLFDGQITAIDASTVTFRQDVTDPLSPVRTRELKKTLYPSEEARQ